MVKKTQIQSAPLPLEEGEPMRVSGLSHEMCRCIIALREGPLVKLPDGNWHHEDAVHTVSSYGYFRPPRGYFYAQTIYALLRRDLVLPVTDARGRGSKLDPLKVELIEGLKRKPKSPVMQVVTPAPSAVDSFTWARVESFFGAQGGDQEWHKLCWEQLRNASFLRIAAFTEQNWKQRAYAVAAVRARFRCLAYHWDLANVDPTLLFGPGVAIETEFEEQVEAACSELHSALRGYYGQQVPYDNPYRDESPEDVVVRHMIEGLWDSVGRYAGNSEDENDRIESQLKDWVHAEFRITW